MRVVVGAVPILKPQQRRRDVYRHPLDTVLYVSHSKDVTCPLVVAALRDVTPFRFLRKTCAAAILYNLYRRTQAAIMAQTPQFLDSAYLPVQLLSDKKLSTLNLRLWSFHSRWAKKGGGPCLEPRNKKKPDARAPHERRLGGVWSYPRGRGIIPRCSLNYSTHFRVKKGNSDDPSSGERVLRGLYYRKLRATPLYCRAREQNAVV